MGVVIIKGIKAIVECSENVYLHYFELLAIVLMNYLSIFWNCVCLFMKLKSYEFEVNSLYC